MDEVKHYDILWVDDFDKGQKVDNYRRYLKDYFPAGFDFRVKIETNFFNALVHLESNFTNYSCVILDVNFINGFNVDEFNDDDRFLREILDSLKSKKVRFENGDLEEFAALDYGEKKTLKEAATFYRLYEILKTNNILLDIGVDPENLFGGESIDYEKINEICNAFNRNDNNFKKNAGYYLFLYLLQRGMPQKNIAMLTGNKGETSKEWEKKFKEANLQSPKAFDRVQCELTKKIQTSEFTDWLNEVFDAPYRFRACMVAMTDILQKMLDDEDTKRKLLASSSMWKDKDRDGDHRSSAIINFHPEYIPFRLPEDEKSAVEILFHFVSQVIVPWDKSKLPDKSKDTRNEEYPYFVTMKTVRNWLAHRVIKTLALQTECFLFGICMRGLFNFSKLDSSILVCYDKWEDELLTLIETLNEDDSFCVDALSSLVVSSSEEIRTRSDYAQIKDEGSVGRKYIHNVLDFMGQSTNAIKCYETDLLRAFLHGVHGDIPSGYTPPGYDRYVGELDDDVRGKYLNAIKRRLKTAVEEAKKYGNKH